MTAASVSGPVKRLTEAVYDKTGVPANTIAQVCLTEVASDVAGYLPDEVKRIRAEERDAIRRVVFDETAPPDWDLKYGTRNADAWQRARSEFDAYCARTDELGGGRK